MLLLSWISPGRGRAIVSLYLLNCTKAQSAYSPLHIRLCTHLLMTTSEHSLRASKQTTEVDSHSRIPWCLSRCYMLMEWSWEFTWGESDNVCIFILLYSCVLTNILLIWIGILFIRQSSCLILLPWLACPPALFVLSFPLTATTASPVMDLARLSLSRRSATYLIYLISKVIAPQSLVNHPLHPCTILKPWTDMVIQNQEYVYRGDPRVIAPSHGYSTRQSVSTTDLDEAFETAISLARGAGPFGGSPVTISSGSTLGKKIFVIPPPGVGRLSGSDRARTDASDEHFFSTGLTDGMRSNVSAYFSQNSLTSLSNPCTATNLRSDTLTALTAANSETQVPTATFTLPSYRLTESGSFRSGDSDISFADSPSTLSRAREIRRRGTSRSHSSGYQTEASQRMTRAWVEVELRLGVTHVYAYCIIEWMVGVIQVTAAVAAAAFLEAAVILEVTVLLRQAAVLRLQVVVIHQAVVAIHRSGENIRPEVKVTPCRQRSQAVVGLRLYCRAKQGMMSALRQIYWFDKVYHRIGDGHTNHSRFRYIVWCGFGEIVHYRVDGKHGIPNRYCSVIPSINHIILISLTSNNGCRIIFPCSLCMQIVRSEHLAQFFLFTNMKSSFFVSCCFLLILTLVTIYAYLGTFAYRPKKVCYKKICIQVVLIL